MNRNIFIDGIVSMSGKAALLSITVKDDAGRELAFVESASVLETRACVSLVRDGDEDPDGALDKLGDWLQKATHALLPNEPVNVTNPYMQFNAAREAAGHTLVVKVPGAEGHEAVTFAFTGPVLDEWMSRKLKAAGWESAERLEAAQTIQGFLQAYYEAPVRLAAHDEPSQVAKLEPQPQKPQDADPLKNKTNDGKDVDPKDKGTEGDGLDTLTGPTLANPDGSKVGQAMAVSTDSPAQAAKEPTGGQRVSEEPQDGKKGAKGKTQDKASASSMAPEL